MNKCKNCPRGSSDESPSHRQNKHVPGPQATMLTPFSGSQSTLLIP